MLRKPLLDPGEVALLALEAHLLADDVDALQQRQPLRDQVGHVDQERPVSGVSRQNQDLDSVQEQPINVFVTIRPIGTQMYIIS